MKRKPKTNPFNIHFKDDYLKLGKRRRLNTQIRNDLLTKFEDLSYFSNEHISKMLDVLLIDLFKDDDSINKFINQVKKY